MRSAGITAADAVGYYWPFPVFSPPS